SNTATVTSRAVVGSLHCLLPSLMRSCRTVANFRTDGVWAGGFSDSWVLGGAHPRSGVLCLEPSAHSSRGEATMKTTLDVAESVQILLDSDIVTKEMIDSWGEPNYHGIVEGIDLRNFGYGDYWGSDYDRSNVRALVRDFPEFLSQWG